MEKYQSLREWLEALENPTVSLTAWESQFLESISDQLDRVGCLSAKQAEILRKLYSEKA